MVFFYSVPTKNRKWLVFTALPTVSTSVRRDISVNKQKRLLTNAFYSTKAAASFYSLWYHRFDWRDKRKLRQLIWFAFLGLWHYCMTLWRRDSDRFRHNQTICTGGWFIIYQVLEFVTYETLRLNWNNQKNFNAFFEFRANSFFDGISTILHSIKIASIFFCSWLLQLSQKINQTS